jgi:hypothetical protein
MKRLVLATAVLALIAPPAGRVSAQEVEAPRAMKPAPDARFDAARFSKVLDAYDSIVVALAADKLDGIKEAAGVIVEHAPNGVIRKRAAALCGDDAVAGLAAAREALKSLSTAIIDYTGANLPALTAALADKKQPLPQKAYCPMAEASWLQHGEKITNPYYGGSMLRCGTFEEMKGK